MIEKGGKFLVMILIVMIAIVAVKYVLAKFNVPILSGVAAAV